MLTHHVPIAVGIYKLIIKEDVRLRLQHIEWVVPRRQEQRRRRLILRVHQDASHIEPTQKDVVVA